MRRACRKNLLDAPVSVGQILPLMTPAYRKPLHSLVLLRQVTRRRQWRLTRSHSANVPVAIHAVSSRTLANA